VSEYDVDLFVMGAGSGGVRAARMAANRGARVAVAESGSMGGTCVNVGCVPKKLMVYASQLGSAFEDAAGFGWKTDNPQFSWRDLVAGIGHEIGRLNSIYDRLLSDAGVEVTRGRARIVDPHTVVVDDRRISADHIVIATGGRPVRPSTPGSELGLVSDDMFRLETMPERIVIIGGGYIGVEFAGILRGLGARVTQLYRGSLFLRGFDDDLRQALAVGMRGRGIDLRFDTEVNRLEQAGEDILVVSHDNHTIAADAVLFATGRVPNTAGLGLEEAGVEVLPSGAVRVDRFSRTTVANIWAIGDCTDRRNLTPVALKEGMAIVETILGGRETAVDYTNIPTAVFSLPNLGTVGLTECEARATGHQVVIYRSSFRPMMNTLSGRDEKTLMKLVVDGATDRVLGVHMAGPDAGEIIQGMAVALKCGVTKAQLDATVGIHPTSAEELVTMRQPVTT